MEVGWWTSTARVLVFISVSYFGTKNFPASRTLAVIAPAFTGPGTFFATWKMDEIVCIHGVYPLVIKRGWLENPLSMKVYSAGKFMYKLDNCDGSLPESTPQIVVFIGKMMLNKWNPGMGVPNCQTNPNGWKMNKTLRKHYVLRNLEQRANSPLAAPRLGVHAGSASRPASWKHGHQQLTVFCRQNNAVLWTASFLGIGLASSGPAVLALSSICFEQVPEDVGFINQTRWFGTRPVETASACWVWVFLSGWVAVH